MNKLQSPADSDCMPDEEFMNKFNKKKDFDAAQGATNDMWGKSVKLSQEP